MKTHLLTFKEKNSNLQAASRIIPLKKDCKIKSADDELNDEFSFQVETKDRTFYFRSYDNENKEAWIKALKKAMTDPIVEIVQKKEEKKTLKKIPQDEAEVQL